MSFYNTCNDDFWHEQGYRMLLLNLGHVETTTCREEKNGQVRTPWKTEIVGWLLQSMAGS